MPTPFDPTAPSDPKSVLDGPSWYVANEFLAFVLELAALACLSWWGFTVGDSKALHVLLGLGTPSAAVVLWWLFAAPKARLRPPLPYVLVVKAVVLGGGAVALSQVGHPVAAVVMAVVVVVNTAVAEVSRRSGSRVKR
ncbi:YrdB family protein [Streptomyces sp. RY43-2]|uniref:YrdB family protein n=1 Tax=Streptomyces macrolidinus TaxID=2952607 RepID=A0ABT0ZFG5_9ACTN|nr:YrdB family protein [Streptomyces macrolidinus]MCN9242326.1 YrdB family protein [Streptomyces macrolidinus]